MDDIVALLAREAGKKFVEAQNKAAVDAARRKAAGGKPAPGTPSAARTSAPAAPPVPARVVAPAAVPQPPAPPAIEPLTIEPLVLPGMALEPPHPSVALLAAFGGGTSLLAGIVLAEALAPPVSLRGTQLFDRLER